MQIKLSFINIRSIWINCPLDKLSKIKFFYPNLTVNTVFPTPTSIVSAFRPCVSVFIYLSKHYKEHKNVTDIYWLCVEDDGEKYVKLIMLNMNRG